jgi:hypothetical protein
MPSALLGREPLAATALVLLVSYVLANRLRPDFEVAAAVPRVPRRARP